jgi:hypothetical protein
VISCRFQVTNAPTRSAYGSADEWSCAMADYLGNVYIEACYLNVDCHMQSIDEMYTW